MLGERYWAAPYRAPAFAPPRHPAGYPPPPASPPPTPRIDPSSMSDIGEPYIGRSLLRREDRRLLTGRGQFIADLVLPRMLHAVLVRSPLAHARIRAVDLSRARAAPGVAVALNGGDLLQMLPPVPEGQISLPRKWTTIIQHKFLNPSQPLLAHNKARHVGAG